MDEIDTVDSLESGDPMNPMDPTGPMGAMGAVPPRSALPTMGAADEVRELSTLENFQAAMADASAFLVVTDRSTPTRVHRTTCATVLPQHFITKVVTNGCKRGRYFKATSFAAAQARFTSRACGVCHPDRA